MMLEIRYIAEPELRGERGPRLLRYLLEHGADELTITVMALQDTPAPFADAFEDELAPFERATAPRRVVSASTSSERIRTVRLWSFTEQSLDRLLGFLDDGLFRSPAGPDGWFEDLAVYRKGELVLGIVSHEQEGVLRLSVREHAELAALGIRAELTGECVSY